MPAVIRSTCGRCKIFGADFKQQKLDMERLVQNSTLFIAAGSETTATLLTATTYFLLTNPVYYEKVVSEVRSSFSDATDITLVSVSKLSWMLACLKESNRMFPVVPSWLPRRLVKGNAVIAGDVVPEGVSAPMQPLHFLLPSMDS